MSYNDKFIKILLIGDSGVGKSCLLLRFCDDSFTPSFISTVGIDFKVKSILLSSDSKKQNEKQIKLQIWDTAGQERFRTITTAYYRGAEGILIVFDVTDERSFHNVSNWIKNVEQFASNNTMKILVGNKSDMREKRVVAYDDAKAFAENYGLQYFETSAKTSEGVNETFHFLAKSIFLKNSTNNEKDKSAIITLHKKSGKYLKNNCC